MADLVLAVDIGGTKMAAGLVAPDGTLVERAMQPTRPWSAPGDAPVTASMPTGRERPRCCGATWPHWSSACAGPPAPGTGSLCAGRGAADR